VDPLSAEYAYQAAINAGSTRVYNNLGLLLSEQKGRESEAEGAYRKAIDAGSTGAYNNLGLLLSEQEGRESEAEGAYRKAIDADSTGSYTNLAILLLLQNRLDEAEEHFRLAFAASKSNISELVNLAAFLLIYRECDEGHQLLDQALEQVTAEHDPEQRFQALVTALVVKPSVSWGTYAAELRTMVAAGLRSHDMDFSHQLVAAREKGHLEIAWLERLVDVIQDRAEGSSLDGWPYWHLE
jgi:Tfp pilus assembly protein PilF